jgi:rfaE bifunctional protein kinase chain/domain
MLKRSLATLVKQFKGKRVLVVGDVMLDEYVLGEVQRISPEAPVPVVRAAQREYAPGGAANAAANIAGLGGQVALAGLVGDDAAGKKLREASERSGIQEFGLLVDPARPTTTKMRVVAEHQQIVRIDSEATRPISPPLERLLMNWVAGRMGHVRACVISDYAKGVVTPSLARRVIRCAADAGIPVVVDPKGNDFKKYRGATIITPNLRETAVAVHRDLIEDSQALDACLEMQRILEGAAVLLTRGARGMMLVFPDGSSTDIATVARHVFDVTGAGDTVVAALALGLACGAHLRDAAEVANCAAGNVVSKRGTAYVTLAELLQA